jgi:Family of unknown function (DUF5719)
VTSTSKNLNGVAKETRASIALLIFILVLHIAHLLPQSSSVTEVTQSYPATACPGPVGDAKATALIPNKKITIREINRPQAEMRKNKDGAYLMNQGALLVEGNAANTMQLQTRANKWTAATTCTVSDPIVWFVGGTANVTSQSKIILVNSGLSDAIVDITSYSENGATQPVPVTVKPSSEKVIRVDSLDPGSSRTTIKVVTRSGRVTSYLLDERVKGLNNVGGDFVAPLSAPSRELIIPGLPIKFGDNSKIEHRLRIMTPGKIDATASIEVISPEGVFIPVGFGNFLLKPEEVRDINLSGVDLGKKTFAVKITATEPIVAAVFTEVKKGSLSDFLWSSPSQTFGSVSFNLYGLEPTFSFVSERVQIEVSWRDSRGKNGSKTLVGEEIVNWKVPANTRLISFVNKSGSVGSMTWITQDGVAHLPITLSTNLESATKPIADISVIQPQG